MHESFSAELNFQVCITVLIACFKKNNFCFCQIECNFISIKLKRKFSKVFIDTSVNGTYAVQDAQKTCIISKMIWRRKSNRILQIIYEQRKNTGPRNNPCGTPKLTFSGSDKILSIETYCTLFVRQDLNQSFAIPLIQQCQFFQPS